MRRMATNKQLEQIEENKEKLNNVILDEEEIGLSNEEYKISFMLKCEPDWTDIILVDENENEYPLTLAQTMGNPAFQIKEKDLIDYEIIPLQINFTNRYIYGWIVNKDDFNTNEPENLSLLHDDGLYASIAPSYIKIQNNIYEYDSNEECYVLKETFVPVTTPEAQIMLMIGPGPVYVNPDF